MKLRKRFQNDEYFQTKSATFKQMRHTTKKSIGYLLGIFGLTFATIFGVYLTSSYFNTNAPRIEALALAKTPHQLSEITLRSKINDGSFPNDVFAAPDDKIVYLQEHYQDIKTFKIYHAYESIRKTDWVNGFYYLGDEATKPPNTYYQPETRRYMDFLCLNNGAYLDIDLEISTNPKKNEDGEIIGYQYLNQYIGDEIYLPYTFANEVLLPKFKEENANFTLNDLLDQPMSVYSVTRDRYTIDGAGNTQTERARKYTIKGIMKANTDETLRDYFIIPFRSELLTQPRLYFFASENAETNNNFLNAIQNCNDKSSLTWGYETPFSVSINNYLKSNKPAKRVGIYGTITIALCALDLFVFALFIKSMKLSDYEPKRRFTIISTFISVISAAIIGSLFVSLIANWSLFSWRTANGVFSSCLFNMTGSLFTLLVAILLLTIMAMGTVKNMKKPCPSLDNHE